MSDLYSGNEEESVAGSLVGGYLYAAKTVSYGRQNHGARFLKRAFDFSVSGVLIILFAIPMAIIALVVKLTSRGSVLYWSNRMGRSNRVFQMPKFRTMKIGTPEIATRLLLDPDSYLTPVGRFLRWSSADELPQLFSVLLGDMSLVGPRPVLLSEESLILMRKQTGVHTLFPGITGWAQVNGRDVLSNDEKVRYDHEYLSQWSLLFDLRILLVTVAKVLRSDGIAH